MKRTIYFILLISGWLISCGTDETVIDPFEGTDNFIYSFALTAGNQVYDAEITDTLIRITLPPKTSLAGASVRYELAEKATIVPAPETIKDWSRPVDFIITSHNGKQQTYTYVYEYEDLVHKGNVFLKTQAEVNAFAATGITAIEGTLTIGFYKDKPVTNVDSLVYLRRIEGSVIFKYPGSLESIHGLENLEEVGSLTIPGNENITSVSFPVLKVVNIDLDVSNDVTDISLPSLRTVVRNFTVWNLGKSSDIGNLESCGGKLTARGNETGFTFSKLMNAGSLNLGGKIDFPALNKVSEIWIGSGMSSFAVLEECENIRAYNDGRGDFPVLMLVTGSAEVSSATSMPVLKTVGGDFSGFSPLLESVGGVLSCNSNTLADMTHLQKAGEIELNLSASADLTGIRIEKKLTVGQSKGVVCTLKGPEECDYILDINFSSEPEGITFEGFKSVGGLSGYIWRGNVSLPFVHEVNGDCECLVGDSQPGDKIVLENLTEVKGTMSLFAHEISCPKLVTIGKKLKCNEKNTAFEELSLPVLETIGDGSLSLTNPCMDMDMRWCKILNIPKLEQIRGSVNILAGIAEQITMPSLSTIDGTLQISGDYTSAGLNNSLTTLAFPLLTTIRKVEIKNCMALKDYSTFAKVIPTLNSSTWRISGCGYNPVWQDMADGNYVGQ